MKKLSTNTTESDLLRARKEGLERARSLEAMRPLGKWKSMDVFAWANPHFDALTTVISNFPFPVVWVGKQSQIKCAVRYYPEVLDTIETVVVSDFGNVRLSGEEIYTIDKVAGVGGVKASLDLVRSFENARRVFLFTTEGEEAHEELELLEEYIHRNE
ncbi:MAG: hypothetical protein ACFHU9_08695 [Fluviicola sp.]